MPKPTRRGASNATHLNKANLTLKEVADHLSVSTSTVRRYVDRGILPYFNASAGDINKRYRFKIEHIKDFMTRW